MSKQNELVNLARSGASGNANIITNGNFIISQRGDYTSSTSVSDGNYYLDRWAYIDDGSPNSTLIHNTDGSVKITTGASVTGSARLRQKFEYSLAPRQYDNKTFTVSAKVKSNSANARINAYAGGYLTLTGTTAHSGGGSFETLTATFTTPSTIAAEFSVIIGIDGVNSANVAITSGDYFEVKEVKMELGEKATNFQHRSFADELALCQRYFYKFTRNNGTGNACYASGEYNTSNHRLTIEHPVTMRANPTITAAFDVSSVTTDFIGRECTGFYKVTPYRMEAGSGGVNHFFQADAEL